LRFVIRKTSAKALKSRKNEVTVNIDNTNGLRFHRTFMMNTTRDSRFKFGKKEYMIDARQALHYKPGFWAFDKKLAIFYEAHHTLATLFDWFNFRGRAAYEIGFLYKTGTVEPVEIKDGFLKLDWAKINFNLRKNSTIEQHFKDVDQRLKGNPTQLKSVLILVAIIIVAIAAVIVISMFTGGNHSQTVQNVTSTVTPGAIILK
jgi:hypothetical protein